MAEKQNTLYVGSLAKGIKLLRAFDQSAPEMTLSELSRRTGLEKSATQRLANTLHLEGMLDKDPKTRRFRPSHAWLELAYAYFWSDPLVGLAMPTLIELSQRFGVTVNLAEISGDHILYVSRIPGKSSQFATTIVGRRLPALNSAAGRAIVSTWPAEKCDEAIKNWTVQQFTPNTALDRDSIRVSLEQTRRQGYAITQDQMILDQTGVSAPIKGHDGAAFSAVQCSFPSRLWPMERIAQDALPYILEAAHAIVPQMRSSL